MRPDYLHRPALTYRGRRRGDDDAADRLMAMDDILTIEPDTPKPKRPVGRPLSDAATLKRRRIAARLVEDGTLPRDEVELLAGVSRRTMFYWLAAHRKTG